MKKIVLMIAAVLVAASSFAQVTADSKLIKADIGFGSGIGGIPIGVSYEQGILEVGEAVVTVGGYVGFESSKDSYAVYSWKRSQIAITLLGNYYLKPMVDKLDLYAGLRLGYRNISSKYVYEDGSSIKYDWGSPFCYSFHIGANYWFSDSFAVNAELGYGIAYLNVGVAYKF